MTRGRAAHTGNAPLLRISAPGGQFDWYDPAIAIQMITSAGPLKVRAP
jgi:hypothetical protein